jgi:hypothetical protein
MGRSQQSKLTDDEVAVFYVIVEQQEAIRHYCQDGFDLRVLGLAPDALEQAVQGLEEKGHLQAGASQRLCSK